MVTPIITHSYAKDISRKIKSVKRDKQRRGLFIGGKAPYGYMLSPKIKNTLLVDERAAEIVLYIFQMSLSGRSCREIAVLLNEQNVPTPALYSNLPTGKGGAFSGLWSSERVAYMLKNRIYTGDMVQGRSRRINYKSKKSIKIPQENWIIVENTHPAIISRKDFEKVQALIESRRSTRKRRYDYLLKGMIFCKECGYPLGVINRQAAGNIPILYFICRTYQRFTKARLCTCHCVKVEAVTDAVMGHISNVCKQYIDNEVFAEIAENVYAEAGPHSNPEARASKLSAQISNISSNMDMLYSDKLNEIVEASDFNRLYSKMKSDRCALQSKLDCLQKQIESSSKPQIDPKRLIEQFISQIPENRDLLSGLIEKIELSAEKELNIYYRFKIPNS